MSDTHSRDKCGRCPCPNICLAWPTFCESAAKQPQVESEIRHICERSRIEAATPMPTVLEQAMTFGGAALKHILNRMQKVTPAEQDHRMAICRACDQYDPASVRCKACGCYLNAKTSWTTEECPLGKWRASHVPPAEKHHEDNGQSPGDTDRA